MKILKGISASSGIVMGTICLYAADKEEAIPHYLIKDDQLENEIKRFKNALEKSSQSIRSKIEQSKKAQHTQAEKIFGAHLSILSDQGISKKIFQLISERKINAEHAVSDVFEEYIDRYQKNKSHFAELVHDLVDIRDGLIASFGHGGGHFVCPVGERKPVIVASKILLPSMMLDIPREHVLAFVTEEGGYTTHATILARSYGVPVVFDVQVDEMLNCGDQVVVDGSLGRVIVLPDAKTREYYQKKIKRDKERKQICSVRKGIPLSTREGAQIILKVNISVPFEINMLKDIYYDGIGLLRTEFLFQKHQPPTEDAQYKIYKEIIENAQGKEVVVRLLDIGTDKMPPYLTLPPQTNPDLGIRGARAVEYFYDVYITQLKALIRASEQGNLKILFPMVSDLSDLMIYRSLFNDARKQLGKKNKICQTGIMIETPSAALLADKFLEEVDFANIGSNDLLQYTLAASRGNAFVEKRYHIVHPAMIRLFEIIIAAGRKHRKEVCLCGEIASFEEFYPLFLTLGLRSFSVPVSKYQEVKCAVSFLKTKGKDAVIQKVYHTTTKEQLDEVFKT